MKKISRKSFLKLAAATAAGTAMAPALMGCAWPDTQDRTPYKGDIAFVGGAVLRVRPGTAHESGSHSSSGSGGGCQLQETFPRNLFHDSVLLLTVSWYRVILVMMDGNGHSPIGSLGLLYFRCTRKNAEKIPTLQKEKDAPQAERGCCASLILSRRTYMESLYLIL